MRRELVLFTFAFLMKNVTAFVTDNLQTYHLESFAKSARFLRDVQQRGLFDNLPDMSNFTNYMVVAHNKVRASIAKKYNIPNMNKLVYDSGIAQKAQTWAESCQYTNNSNNLGYSENRAFKLKGSGSMVELLKKIFDEANYNVESKTCAPYSKYPYCQNYLNAISPTSVYIGCGRTTCPFLRKGNKLYVTNADYIVCYYSPGNAGSKTAFPESGTAPCSACQNSCVDGALCTPNVIGIINSAISILNSVLPIPLLPKIPQQQQ